MYTAEKHSAVYSDYVPVGEIRCLTIDGEDVAHYRLLPKGTQFAVTLVERTTPGTGPMSPQTWYDTWGPWFMSSPEAAEQLISDHYCGVTRIQYEDGVHRYLGGERLENAL
jgi:hypothetical protein